MQYSRNDSLAKPILRRSAGPLPTVPDLATRPPFWFAKILYFCGCFTISFEVPRIVGDVSQASDWIFVAAVGAATMQVFVRRDDIGNMIPFGVIAGFVTYAAATAVSAVLRGDPSSSAIAVARVGFLSIPWTWLGCTVLRNEADVRAAVLAWGLGLAVSGIAALGQFFFGDIIPGVYPAINRMSGLTRHPNTLAGAIAIAAAPMLEVALRMRGHRWLFGMGIVGLCLTGLLLSGSVGGMLGAVGAFGSWLLFTRRITLRAAAAVSSLVIAAFVGSDILGRHGVVTPIGRIANEVLGDEDSPTLDVRKDGAKLAWEKIKRRPLTGEGAGREGMVLEGAAQHNLILAFWLDSGLFGLLGILAIFASAASSLVRDLSRLGRGTAADFAASLAASMIGMLLYAQSAPLVVLRHIWMPIGLAIALSYRLRSRATDARRRR